MQGRQFCLCRIMKFFRFQAGGILFELRIRCADLAFVRAHEVEDGKKRL